MPLRLTVANNARQTEKSILILKTPSENPTPECRALFETILDHARKKLRMKAKTFRIFHLKDGRELHTDVDILALANDSVVLVSAGEEHIGKAPMEDNVAGQPKALVTVFATKSFIHEDAVKQLERTALLPGVKIAAGMPDLHPGSSFPVGASFASVGTIYPGLVGSDIGCGMLLKKTSLSAVSDPRKVASKMVDLEGPWSTEQARLDWLTAGEGLSPTGYEDSLGTIGAGNHFAEIQIVEEVVDEAGCSALGIDPAKCLLLVHSGSRGFGQSILDGYSAKFGNMGVKLGTVEANDYLQKHELAIQWARRNRALIAHRIFGELGLESPAESADQEDPDKILDVWHNLVEEKEFAAFDEIPAQRLFVHRKGAAPSDGPVVIPGSRGSYSFLVQPLDAGRDSALSCYSLAHGAGRLLTRHKALEKIGDHAKKKGVDLEVTSLGSVVVCSDKTLLYEEAPEAYKSCEDVVQDLVDAGLCKVLAVLKPLVTYKVR